MAANMVPGGPLLHRQHPQNVFKEVEAEEAGFILHCDTTRIASWPGEDCGDGPPFYFEHTL